MEIKQLEEFIKPLLNHGKKFVSYKCQNLLSSGENYGSVMLRVEIQLLNDRNEEEIIHCVAKTCPLSEFLWKVFNTKVTFKKEIALYTKIVPSLIEFGAEQGVDNLINFFAKPLVARISLDPTSNEVDKDAVLLLENLKVQGYDIMDRFNGFDMECTKLVLKDLAIMHATPVAYKLAKPEEFKSKILLYLTSDFIFTPSDEFVNNFATPMHEAAARNPECVPHLSKLLDGLNNLKVPAKTTVKEPFATLTHNDYWVNNTMIKMVNGKPEKNVIVDFQIIEYGSPAHDLVFFLYTSVAMSILKQGIDDLIKYYYEIFIDTLKKLKCDVSIFSFDALMEECCIVAKEREFSHILIMLNPIFTLKNKAKDLSNFKETDIVTDGETVHENYYERLQFVLLDFVRRGWTQ